MQKLVLWTVGHAAQHQLKKWKERTTTAQLCGERSALERVSELCGKKLNSRPTQVRQETRIIFLYSKLNKRTVLQIDKDDLRPCTIIVNSVCQNK